MDTISFYLNSLYTVVEYDMEMGKWIERGIMKYIGTKTDTFVTWYEFIDYTGTSQSFSINEIINVTVKFTKI
jgi:hypothetical protein